MRNPIAGAALLFCGTTAAFAHDMSHMDGVGHKAPAASFAFGEPGQAAKAGRTVNIVMKDMSFEPVSVEATVGETIRFAIVNQSATDHDFTIGDVKTQTAHRAEMAEMMANGAMHHHDDPNAVMIGPGEKRELIWKFTRPGDLEFDCNVPGHYEAGMKGAIVVRDKS